MLSLIITIILLIVIIIYFSPYLNIYYYFKINNLLNNRKLRSIEDKKELLERPLYEFMVNTSHNTYITSIQHATFGSYYGYEFALKAGARYIEIDINSFKDNIPIVVHSDKKIITTYYILLDKTLDTIINHGFNTTDPLIIDIEMPITDNNILNTNIINTFKEKFGNKLLLPSDLNNDLVYLPIKSLLNKVIIINRTNNTLLNSIMHNPYHFENLSNNEDRLKCKKFNDKFFSRVYLDASFKSVFSRNIDSDLYRIKYNHNAIALNFQTRDEYLYNNLVFFNDYSFVHNSEITTYPLYNKYYSINTECV